jgi:serine/threonine protein kinase
MNQISAGTRLGSYEVTGLIGKGGMGEVYVATDAKLGRSVAIKVLPAIFASDDERRARLEREARVLASLNHPHIAAIYQLEESVGRSFLVMEFVAGDNLAQTIARGPLETAEALTFARQIAEALEAAHEKGIVHRDLKPANVKVTPDGQVKVLDFGLAKAFVEERPGDLSNSPTLSRAVTGAGIILGTAAYMSPEQAQGKPVDRRTDIFSFGCLLFEMLSGRPPFQGETVTEILAAVIKSEPEWNLLPSDTPAMIHRILRRCLQKDRNRRFQSSGDLRLEIEEAFTDTEIREPAVPSRKRGEALGWLVAGLLAISLAATLAVTHWRRPAEAPEMRVDVATPSTPDAMSFALSPDGQQLVFVASGGGRPRLWLRSFSANSSQPLMGTEGASFPFWSPNSRSIAFFADGKLKRLDIGGAPQILADAGLGRGGAWSPDGVILFAPNGGGPLMRIPAAGGSPVASTKLLPEQTSHRFPRFLPDGRQFLFLATGPEKVRGTYIGSLDSRESNFLADIEGAVSYLPSGWLLSVRQGTLFAWPFDISRRQVSSDPVTVADPVGYDTISTTNAVSVSASGLIAYRSGMATRRQLKWFDRSGRVLGVAGPTDESDLADPELSPDGTRIAIDRNVENNIDIWLLDGARRTRFTFDPWQEAIPIWSPDGSRIIFRSGRRGGLDLFQKPSNLAGSDESVVESGQLKLPTDWSRDNRFILYVTTDPKTSADMWVLPVGKGQQPYPFLNTAAEENAGKFSPDVKWVAYQSNETGQFQIYVRSFPNPGAKWQVTTAGGTQPRWAANGKELYYVSPDGKLMAVPIVAKDTIIEPGEAVPLFDPQIANARTSAYRAQYDVSRDGRFLVNVSVEDSAASPITLLLNWKGQAK